jgi:hypothetical protein
MAKRKQVMSTKFAKWVGSVVMSFLLGTVGVVHLRPYADSIA